MDRLEQLAPISIIGTAANMNAAIDNGLARRQGFSA
jgi:formamidase